MHRFLASVQRRLTITILVIFALFATCAGASAMPCDAYDAGPAVTQVADHDDGDDAATASVPSIEDNTNLDDTFDVPSQHIVTLLRAAPSPPSGFVPGALAKRVHLDLRPPIA